MTVTISKPIPLSPLLDPLTHARPLAHRIGSDSEAIDIAERLSADFALTATERDRDRRLPKEELDLFSQSGLWAITVPTEYGGAGVSNVTLAKIVALISAADPSIGQIPQNHFAVTERIRLNGTPGQKAFFFDRVLAGDRFGNATAEPGDKRAKDQATRVRRRGDGYRLDGRKVYSTGALFAHWVPVTALDEEGRSWVAFADRQAEGLTVIDDWDGFGQRTTASGAVILDNVFVPADRLLRGSGDAARVDTSNSVSQLVHAAIDLGIAKAAIDETRRFLREDSYPARGSGVVRATDDPLAVRDIGELIVNYNAAEALTERAGRLVDVAIADAGQATAITALQAIIEAKILTTQISLQATTKLFELAGTKSVHARYGLDRHWRNARVHTLHDGIRWKYHAVGNFHLNGLQADQWTLGHPYSPSPTDVVGHYPTT